MIPGVEHAWEVLAGLDTEDVCRRALVRWEAPGYGVPCLGQELRVCPERRELSSETAAGGRLVGKLRYFTELAVLRYLIDARPIPPAGELVRPHLTPGGAIYREGSHVLPLAGLAARYGRGPEALVAKARELGGRALALADASAELHVFPRVPVTVLLWRGDDEFEARADLLLDSTCTSQLPADIVWSAAMMAVLSLF
jgi:hypothetical protein